MTNQIKMPSLDGDKVLELYPLSIGAYKKWLGAFPKAEELGGDKDALMYDHSLKAILYYSPRNLYEFFDKLGLELVVGKVDDHWYYTVTGDLHSYSSNSRIEAEEAGFQLCFEVLEKQLSK